MNDAIRFSLTLTEDGSIEIYSCVTRTALTLPMEDIDLLIANLSTFGRNESPRETIYPDPSSQTCVSDRIT